MTYTEKDYERVMKHTEEQLLYGNEKVMIRMAHKSEISKMFMVANLVIEPHKLEGLEKVTFKNQDVYCKPELVEEFNKTKESDIFDNPVIEGLN